MDMISELSDDLILKILSSLFLRDSIITSVLSRRWLSLWKLKPKLKVGQHDECSRRFRVSILNSLAFSNPQVLKSLDFEFDPYDFDRKIKSWIEPAVHCGLREVKIESFYTSMPLPKSLYACETLETLILCKLHLENVPSYACLSSLKSLHLLSVKFSRDEDVQQLLSMCPVLEDLVTRRSTYVSVEIYTINVPSLKSLSIDYSWALSRPASVHGFVINTPSLTCLNIRDHYSNLLQFTNMPKLVKANIDVVCDRSESLFGSLSSTRHLSLCSKISNIPYLEDTFFFFIEHLELCTCSPEWWNLLTRILKDAPRLRVLKLKTIHCAHYNYPMDRWSQPSSAPECLSSHLEILEWRQYKGTKPDKQVAKYILANAGHLKMATFSLKSTEKHQMFKKLESMPICSKACQLLLD